MHIRLFTALIMIMSLIAPANSYAQKESEIRQHIIQQSIAAYPGRCPCPYNVMSNGRRCGKRSAWSRPGGYAPLCYPADVSDAMVKAYRRKEKQ